MICGLISLVRGTRGRRRPALAAVALFAASGLAGILNAWGDDAVSKSSSSRSSKQSEARPPASKRIIGATASITEVSSGIAFAARIDTGAKTCSLHVENMRIENESSKRLENIGKKVNFDLIGDDGKTKRVEATIASAVRVRSSVFKNGEFDRRYKVRLTLQWKDFQKEVLVTLNDRTEMTYPLLIGRNFLRGDFLVDVEKNRDND